jgi:predicted nucleic acid-binding protein
VTEAVVDAGPLIHLAELGALDVLADLDVLRVANAVWEEVLKHQPAALQDTALKLQRLSPPAPSAELLVLTQALLLARGEVESLCVLEAYAQSWFLTDDAAARLAATQRGYRVHGTIGLLIRSVRRGRRAAGDVLQLLRKVPRQSTLHIRPTLLQEILQTLEREWDPS